MEGELADAKTRLSELVMLATTEGPQLIHHADETAVLLSEASYQALIGKPSNLKDWLFRGPSLEGVNVDRDRGSERDVDL